MIIASASTTALQTTLQSSGISTAKAKLVQTDLDQAVQSAGGASAKPASVREALDKQIQADVASGKLSKDDAATIDKALDQMGDTAVAASADTDATQTASAGGAAKAGGGGHAGGGGGGGGGSSTKTELSETVTVAGSVKTTVITYTDGTSDTTTSVATSQDEQRYGHDATKAESDATVTNYLSSLPPGTLVDTEA